MCNNPWWMTGMASVAMPKIGPCRSALQSEVATPAVEETGGMSLAYYVAIYRFVDKPVSDGTHGGGLPCSDCTLPCGGSVTTRSSIAATPDLGYTGERTKNSREPHHWRHTEQTMSPVLYAGTGQACDTPPRCSVTARLKVPLVPGRGLSRARLGPPSQAEWQAVFTRQTSGLRQ
jgi:hypothetical protein